MRYKRIWAMFRARNYEFFRDKAAFGWNFLFPFLIIAGFALIFNNRDQQSFKVGVYPATAKVSFSGTSLPAEFIQSKQLQFIGFPSREAATNKLAHHQIDFLVELNERPLQYFVSDSSPKGYIVEKMFKASLLRPEEQALTRRGEIGGREIRYIEWLFPGILAMNMMFSSLWGVGYVVVRYRKNGVLKRLNATPLTAFEYLTAQLLSRLFLLIFTIVIVWTGCQLLFGFHVVGSYLNLLIVYSLGSLSLTAMGLALAARGTSEEFTSGVLNFISWPMMFLSEVWFSMEGSPSWILTCAEFLPLTHLNRAVRKIMNDGAGLADVSSECMVLLVTALIFLSLGAALFSWNE